MGLRQDYERIVAQLAREVEARYGPRLITCAVYGSVGRRAARHGSDVDVLIVARDMPAGRAAQVEEFLPVEDGLAPLLKAAGHAGIPVHLSPVFKSPDEVEAGSPLFLDMTEDAWILFDRDEFFARYLDGLRDRLRALGARRIWRGSAWYWDLKPDFEPGDVIRL